MRSPSRLLQFVLVAAAPICLPYSAGGPTAAEAQATVRRARVVYRPGRHRYHWGYYNIADVISSRVHAQADLIRARGDVILSVEEARQLHLESRSKSYDLELKRLDTLMEKQHKLEAARFHRLREPLRKAKQRNSRAWDKIKNHPELNYGAIADGRGLNFLLHRLSGTVLSYEFSKAPGSDYKSRSEFVGLDLTKETIDALNLVQRVGTGGRGNVFKASSGVGLNIVNQCLRPPQVP